MKKTLVAALGLCLLLTVISLGCSVQVGPPPSAPPAAGYARTVSASSLLLRTCPGSTCQVVTSLPYGQVVTVYEYNNNWAKVQVPNGPFGWVDYRYLAP